MLLALVTEGAPVTDDELVVVAVLELVPAVGAAWLLVADGDGDGDEERLRMLAIPVAVGESLLVGVGVRLLVSGGEGVPELEASTAALLVGVVDRVAELEPESLGVEEGAPVCVALCVKGDSRRMRPTEPG